MYGSAQRRKRTFIFAYIDDSEYGHETSNKTHDDMIEHGFMSKAFPIKSILNYDETTISTDVLYTSDNFSFNFENAGCCTNGIITTAKIIEKREDIKTLGSVMEKNVDEKYYIPKDKLEKWRLLKGKKSIERVSKTGYQYTFSEGAIAFPELTSEGTLNRSSHVIRDPETKRLRILTPVEAERLQGFDDDWTNTGMSDRARYFCMGNALVVSMITRMGQILDEIISKEALDGERV